VLNTANRDAKEYRVVWEYKHHTMVKLTNLKKIALDRANGDVQKYHCQNKISPIYIYIYVHMNTYSETTQKPKRHPKCYWGTHCNTN